MAIKDNNATPPEWIKRLERRVQERMAKTPQDPFTANSWSTRLLYWMMLVLTSCTSLLIILHVFATKSLYLVSFLLISIGIWAALNHWQKKKNRVIWQAFPKSFAQYVMSRNRFFRASWHMIFTILITGFFVVGSRFSGLEALLISNQSVQAKRELTPEDKVVLKQLEKLTGVKVPESSLVGIKPSSSQTPTSSASTTTPPKTTPANNTSK